MSGIIGVELDRIRWMHAGGSDSDQESHAVCRSDLSAVALQLSVVLRGAGSSARPALGSRLHPVAVHGNYRRYYGYRLDRAFGKDPRLQVRYQVRKSWMCLKYNLRCEK